VTSMTAQAPEKLLRWSGKTRLTNLSGRLEFYDLVPSIWMETFPRFVNPVSSVLSSRAWFASVHFGLGFFFFAGSSLACIPIYWIERPPGQGGGDCGNGDRL
jgi:hypothetical protein